MGDEGLNSPFFRTDIRFLLMRLSGEVIIKADLVILASGEEIYLCQLRENKEDLSVGGGKFFI